MLLAFTICLFILKFTLFSQIAPPGERVCCDVAAVNCEWGSQRSTNEASNERGWGHISAQGKDGVSSGVYVGD